MPSLQQPGGVRGRTAAIRRQRTRQDVVSLFRTAAPIAAVGLANVAISVTDMAMMAALDPAALAAGAVVSDIYSVGIQFAAGAVAGVVPAIARATATDDRAAIGRLIAFGLRIAAVLGLAGCIAVGHLPQALAAVGIALPLPDLAEGYAAWMGATFALMLVVASARAMLPALGRGIVPLAVLAAAVPLNALGNAILMHGWFGLPAMGLVGAGAASFLVGAVSASALILYLLCDRGMRRYRVAATIIGTRPFIPLAQIRASLFTGAVSLCETSIYLCSTLFVGIVAVGAVPAHVAVFRSLSITYCLTVGFSQAVTIELARALALKRLGRPESLRRAARAGLLVLAPLFAAAIVALPVLAGIATGAPADTGMRAAMAELAPLAAASAAAVCASGVAFGLLRAEGSMLAPSLASLAGYWGVGLPVMLLATLLLGLGPVGIWTGLFLGSLATAGIAWGYRLRGMAAAWLVARPGERVPVAA